MKCEGDQVRDGIQGMKFVKELYSPKSLYSDKRAEQPVYNNDKTIKIILTVRPSFHSQELKEWFIIIIGGNLGLLFYK